MPKSGQDGVDEGTQDEVPDEDLHQQRRAADNLHVGDGGPPEEGIDGDPGDTGEKTDEHTAQTVAMRLTLMVSHSPCISEPGLPLFRTAQDVAGGYQIALRHSQVLRSAPR